MQSQMLVMAVVVVVQYVCLAPTSATSGPSTSPKHAHHTYTVGFAKEKSCAHSKFCLLTGDPTHRGDLIGVVNLNHAHTFSFMCNGAEPSITSCQADRLPFLKRAYSLDASGWSTSMI
jgi:hypothetical protein